MSILQVATRPKDIKEAKKEAQRIAIQSFINKEQYHPHENKKLINAVDLLMEKQGTELTGIMFQEYCRKLNCLNSKLYSEGEKFREEIIQKYDC